MKKTKFLLYLIFFFIIPGALLSNEKIVFVDMEYLLQKSKAGIKIIKNFDNLQKEKNKYFEELAEKLKKQENDIIAKKNIISTDEYNNLVLELRKEINQYKLERDNFLKDMQNQKIQYLGKFVKLINPILAEYSKNNTIDLIVDKKNIIIGKNSLDITNDILIIIDENIKKIKLD